MAAWGERHNSQPHFKIHLGGFQGHFIVLSPIDVENTTLDLCAVSHDKKANFHGVIVSPKTKAVNPPREQTLNRKCSQPNLRHCGATGWYMDIFTVMVIDFVE